MNDTEAGSTFVDQQLILAKEIRIRAEKIHEAAEKDPANKLKSAFAFLATKDPVGNVEAQFAATGADYLLEFNTLFYNHNSRSPRLIAQGDRSPLIADKDPRFVEAYKGELESISKLARDYALFTLREDPFIVAGIEQLADIVDPLSKPGPRNISYPQAHGMAVQDVHQKYDGIAIEADPNARREYSSRLNQHLEEELPTSGEKKKDTAEYKKEQLRQFVSKTIKGIEEDYGYSFSGIFNREFKTYNYYDPTKDEYFFGIGVPYALCFPELSTDEVKRLLDRPAEMLTYLKMYARAQIAYEAMSIYNSFKFNQSNDQNLAQAAAQLRDSLSEPEKCIFPDRLGMAVDTPGKKQLEDLKSYTRWKVIMSSGSYIRHGKIGEAFVYDENGEILPKATGGPSVKAISAELAPSSITSYLSERAYEQRETEFREHPPFEIQDRRNIIRRALNPITELSIATDHHTHSYEPFTPTKDNAKITIQSLRAIEITGNNEIKLYLPQYADISDLYLDLVGDNSAAVLGEDFQLLYSQEAGNYKIALTDAGKRKYAEGTGSIKYRAEINVNKKEDLDPAIERPGITKLIQFAEKFKEDGFTQAYNNIKVLVASGASALHLQDIINAIRSSAKYTFSESNNHNLSGGKNFPFLLKPSSEGYLPVQCDHASEITTQLLNEVTGTADFYTADLIPVEHNLFGNKYEFFQYHNETRKRGTTLRYDATPELIESEDLEQFQERTKRPTEEIQEEYEELILRQLRNLERRGYKQDAFPRAVVLTGELMNRINEEKQGATQRDPQEYLDQIAKLISIWNLAQKGEGLDRVKAQAYRDLFGNYNIYSPRIIGLLESLDRSIT